MRKNLHVFSGSFSSKEEACHYSEAHFIAPEDDSLDWLFPLGDIPDTGYPEFIAGVGALAIGSATYEWMLHQPASSSGFGPADRFWLCGAALCDSRK